MNVLFYSALPSMRYGGVAGWMRHMVTTLRAQGHEVNLFAWGREEPDARLWGTGVRFLRTDAGLARVPIARFWIPLLAAARAGRRLIEELSVDVIHTVGLYETWSAARARGTEEPAIVLSIHGDYVTESSQHWRSRWRRRLYLPLERSAIRACDAVTTSSVWLAERLGPELSPARARVIPNGIVAPSGADMGVGPALDLTEGRRVVLTMNSLYAPYRKQGLRLLIAAAPKILERVPDVLFVVVGGVNDPERDRELVAWAQEEARGLPFHFTGYRQRPPHDLLEIADLYVHPSFLDNSPTAVMEAMAMGRPIVATEIGGIPELVSDGETALLVPLDPEALARAVVRLLEDRPLAESLGARARQVALSQFTWDRVGRQFSELYREARAARGGREGRAHG